jgi:hypothetical protein
MSRRPARVTQAEINRALRAARQAGAAGVDVQRDGTIRILLAPPLAPEQPIGNCAADDDWTVAV